MGLHGLHTAEHGNLPLVAADYTAPVLRQLPRVSGRVAGKCFRLEELKVQSTCAPEDCSQKAAARGSSNGTFLSSCPLDLCAASVPLRICCRAACDGVPGEPELTHRAVTERRLVLAALLRVCNLRGRDGRVK